MAAKNNDKWTNTSSDSVLLRAMAQYMSDAAWLRLETTTDPCLVNSGAT